MNSVCSIPSHILHPFPRLEIEAAVRRHNAHQHVRGIERFRAATTIKEPLPFSRSYGARSSVCQRRPGFLLHPHRHGASLGPEQGK